MKIVDTKIVALGYKTSEGEAQYAAVHFLSDGSLFVNGKGSVLFFPNAKDFTVINIGDDQSSTGVGYDYIDNNDSGTKWFTFSSIYGAGRASKFRPYDAGWDGNISSLKNNSNLGCYMQNNGKERAYCAKLIQLNNWKIPDDYPLF